MQLFVNFLFWHILIDLEMVFWLISVPGCTDFVSSVEQIELLANQMQTTTFPPQTSDVQCHHQR